MRLGDLDALKAILFNDTQYGFWHDSMNGSDVAYTQRDLFKCIDAMSTIDAVPVVRCRNCDNHSESNGYHYCKFWKMYCPDDSDFFCKAGK